MTVLTTDLNRYPVSTVRGGLAIGNNQQLVAAMTNIKIRVMGWIAQSNTGTASAFQLKSNSAGTTIMAPLTVPPVTNGLSDKLPIFDSGYMETSAGHGLYVDVTGADLNLTLFYITYSP